RKLQTGGDSDVFEAYLALCSSGAGSRRSTSLSQTTPVSNSNLVHTNFSSVCGPSALLPGRSFHAYRQHSYPVSQDGGNTQEHCALRSTIGVNINGSSDSHQERNMQVYSRLNSAVRVGSHSRRTIRRVLTSGSAVATNSAASAETSYTYRDLGDCDRRRRYCGASFWYVECLKRVSNNQTPEYHLCCGGGRFQMQRLRKPPDYIKILFQNKHLMENIRAYNQMFAMTSFGAKIDESINARRGSYVFKVSGQIYHWIGSLCPPAGEPPRELDIPEFKIRLYNAEGARGYELPTSNTLGLMVFENGISDNANFDVIIEHRDGPPQRVNKLHPSYMSLQFPLLFIYGQPRYHKELTLKSATGVGRGKRLTMLAYYRYQLHFRLQQYDLLFRVGRLFQQYVVGVFCAVEHNRLDFLRKKQNDIRSDYLSGLYDAISRGERDGYEVGGRIILPMSFTCGPRYMYAHYLDALAVFWKLGNLQFFITFTCNVNWLEIKRFMSEYPHLTASDRVDVVCRVFEQKIHALIAFLKEERIFGDVTGVLYTVKFQKRGLPHCHTLLWVDSASRIRIAKDVDQFISADLKASCMKGDKCSKKFPKKFNDKTFFDENGHVHYQRRDTCVSATRNNFQLDNSYVVPYNRHLLLAFRAHINVEYCGWSMLIKYMFKYISNGTDRVFARVSRPIGESSTAATPSRQEKLVATKNQQILYWTARVCASDFRRAIHFNNVTMSSKRVQGFLGSANCQRHFFPTYRVAYQALGLLDPSRLWRKYWKEMSYDIPKKVSEKVQIPDYHLNDDSLQGYTLYEIEIVLRNCGKSFHMFGLPSPPQDLMTKLANSLLMEERSYDREQLA
nr:DNA helicase [Tanacetum cinerariifolium]